MIKRIEKWWRQQKLNRRLRKMEKELGLRLSDDQRALVLDPDPPQLAGWGRQSGKTLCACLHFLLHSPTTALYTRSEALALLPDPDLDKGYPIRMYTYQYLFNMHCRLIMAGIPTCMLLPPMPQLIDEHFGHGHYAGQKSGKGR